MHDRRAGPRDSVGPAALRKWIFALSALAVAFAPFETAPSYGETILVAAPTEQPIYMKSDSGPLRLWMWEGSQPPIGLRAAIVFFHGGGFVNGAPSQFAQLCRMLASLGVLAASAEYSVSQGDAIRVDRAILEAKAAIRWIRDNAARLHVDPRRIAAGGGSAGGYLAVATALPGNGSGKMDVSSTPNALVLFNPVFTSGTENDTVARTETKLPLPPTILMHGTADQTSPFTAAQTFANAARGRGSGPVELIAFPGRRHGFFNYSGGANPDFLATEKDVVRFLRQLGWIAPSAPTQP